MPQWRNWQTRYVQGVVSNSSWGFKSLLRHQKERLRAVCPKPFFLLYCRHTRSPGAKFVFRLCVWSVAVASSPRQANRQTPGNSTGQNGELTSNRSILLLVGLLVAAFFVFGYLDRINTLAAVRSEIVSAREDVAQAEQRNAELEATLNEVAGETYVGETARAELGLIQPGDDPFVLLGPEPSTDAETQPNSQPNTQPNTGAMPPSEVESVTPIDIFSGAWWRSLFGL